MHCWAGEELSVFHVGFQEVDPVEGSTSIPTCSVRNPLLVVVLTILLGGQTNLRRLDRQQDCRAFFRTWLKMGNKRAARIAIIAITTNNSISVNSRCVSSLQ